VKWNRICAVAPALVAGIHVVVARAEQETRHGRDMPGHDIETLIRWRRLRRPRTDATAQSIFQAEKITLGTAGSPAGFL
jgi:hypothetical protein